MESMLSVDGTSTIRCHCWSVGKSEGWQRHAQLKGIDNECAVACPGQCVTHVVLLHIRGLVCC